MYLRNSEKVGRATHMLTCWDQAMNHRSHNESLGMSFMPSKISDRGLPENRSLPSSQWLAIIFSRTPCIKLPYIEVKSLMFWHKPDKPWQTHVTVKCHIWLSSLPFGCRQLDHRQLLRNGKVWVKTIWATSQIADRRHRTSSKPASVSW